MLRRMNESEMSRANNELLQALRDDHAMLAAGLHELNTRLRASDYLGARDVAQRVDIESGAHIAFEEMDFYPALAPFLADKEIDQMYQDHVRGEMLIQRIASLDVDSNLTAQERNDMLQQLQKIQVHVSECGEVFSALGNLAADEKCVFLESLRHWREVAPRWRQVAALSAHHAR